MEHNKLSEYARLVVEMGVNVQAGEPVLISCPVEHAAFARLLARHAYARGAKDVAFNWRDDELTRLRYENAPLEVFETVPQWAFDRTKYYYEQGANLISVSCEDPELLSGIDPKKIMAASKANNEKFKPLDRYVMSDILSWCVVAVPNEAWAMKVFPGLSAEEAVQALWEKIFEVTRMNAEDPVDAWSDHIASLNAHAAALNRNRFVSMHYKSSNGTDLTVKLPEGHVWMAAGSHDAKGTYFLPNIPTEEVFSAPLRDGVNGTLVSTKPLSYNGQLIEGFRLAFKDGEVVDFTAEKGGEALKSLFEEDPRARRLGEIALVPHRSPISDSGLLFFNTLFDENASCHFAFGAAYPTCLEGGADLDDDALVERGLNVSQIHEDFMVGCADLSIIGTRADGAEVVVFENGNFAESFR